MALREIRTEGDPILGKKTKPVKELTPRLKELISDMYETMRDANGVGLAAPQVGILKQIVTIEVEEGGECYTLINPRIISSEGEQTDDKGVDDSGVQSADRQDMGGTGCLKTML